MAKCKALMGSAMKGLMVSKSPTPPIMPTLRLRQFTSQSSTSMFKNSVRCRFQYWRYARNEEATPAIHLTNTLALSSWKIHFVIRRVYARNSTCTTVIAVDIFATTRARHKYLNICWLTYRLFALFPAITV